MDRDLLRGLLAILGVILVLGIYFWDRMHNRSVKSQSETGAHGADNKETSEANLTHPSDENIEELNMDPFGPATESSKAQLGEEPLLSQSTNQQAARRWKTNLSRRQNLEAGRIPDLVQFAIVSDGGYFSGTQLFEEFADLDLKYGPMNIFHGYQDGTDNIEFSVATMVEPGIFPDKDIASFKTPGVTLFFQPTQVPTPVDSFDNMVSTCQELARRLNGKILDGDKEPLTGETLMKIRNILQ